MALRESLIAFTLIFGKLAWVSFRGFTDFISPDLKRARQTAVLDSSSNLHARHDGVGPNLKTLSKVM